MLSRFARVHCNSNELRTLRLRGACDGPECSLEQVLLIVLECVAVLANCALCAFALLVTRAEKKP